MIAWIIKHPDNEQYFADVEPDRVWTTDPHFACRYDTVDTALNVMVERFNGKGEAVTIDIPRKPVPSALGVFKL